MTDNLTAALDVYGKSTKNRVARISLNGYDIAAGGIFPSTGSMRSFVLVDGDLWDQWNAVESLTLVNEDGTKTTIRVAALPVEDDGYGLIEFL
ncbi:MAG: hypothetical protein IAF02_21900 [Anaerolineae bacterium]|nr:hypothetical protein [Anaerolineae bacterium]